MSCSKIQFLRSASNRWNKDAGVKFWTSARACFIIYSFLSDSAVFMINSITFLIVFSEILPLAWPLLPLCAFLWLFDRLLVGLDLFDLLDDCSLSIWNDRMLLFIAYFIIKQMFLLIFIISTAHKPGE